MSISAVSPDRLMSMREAVIGGNLAKVKLLLKAGVPPTAATTNMTLLQMAARFGHFEVFKTLLDAGAPITDPELLEHAVDWKTPSLDIVRHILSQAPPPRANLDASLRYASVQGNTEIVQELINAGADVNAIDGYYGNMALLNAILEGHADVVALLLSAGANPNVRVFDDPDTTPTENPHKRKTALELAASLGHARIVELLRAAMP